MVNDRSAIMVPHGFVGPLMDRLDPWTVSGVRIVRWSAGGTSVLIGGSGISMAQVVHDPEGPMSLGHIVLRLGEKMLLTTRSDEKTPMGVRLLMRVLT